ncbi:TPA: Eco57I restriction-modification methylase domain-containing protein [Streptococcus suis]
MKKHNIEAIEILDRIIIGRVEPHIYAFTTNTVPNYLKIGDTYRAVSQRLNEWKVYFPDLKKEYSEKAIIDDKTYFRDYSIHQFLEYDLGKVRVSPYDLDEGVYFSKEFFKDTSTMDVDNAISDIKKNFDNNTGKYEYYSSENRLPETFHYVRGDAWPLRPNQEDAVKSFINAVKKGRTNLLMYAVMRFGKSFTSLCCALEMNANIVLVVSAKADVKDEWKKTVELAGNFHEYVFLEANDLASNDNLIKEKISDNKKVVLFLTLQDLQGEKIKEKHKELFEEQIDLLIVDETHFGARAESFGKILENSGYEKLDNKNIKKLDDEIIDTNVADEQLKKLNARIRLHLSGTPYRILMGSEFDKEDIISFVQFTDIVKAQEEWDKNNLNKDDVNEWDNPYYGFPQMVRFAFNPNESSRKKMAELKRNGVTFAFSKLFEPKSIKKDLANENHKEFINNQEVLDLLQVIDGSKSDENLLGFLDYEKIKEGKMCRHMVMVLPYCASCDAMEKLINTKRDAFKNLNEYEIINISGLDASKKYKKPSDVKSKIKDCEDLNQKTLTLTVNRMLTGSTVEQWDTMLYFKDTSSPQEYDQSIFRLQNQYVRTLSSENGVIKENLKPQTILVDFDPDRLFRMQEQKSLIYNVNTEKNGNSRLKERINEELRISPVIMMNHNKIKQVNATNVLDAISEYNNQRSVSDEVVDIPVDLSILDDEKVRSAIEQQAEFNSKKGLTLNPIDDDEDDLDLEEGEDIKPKEKTDKGKEGKSKKESKIDDDSEIKKLESKIKTYYQRVLFFAFLTKDKVSSLDDILNVIDKGENIRLSKNLSIDKGVLENISILMDPFKRSRLDYKIQNISNLAFDESLEPLERAMTSIKKFNRMSESEVITPSKVCDEMVALLPEDGLNEIVSKQDKLLDIASKSGEYAVSIYKRLTIELGYNHEMVKDIIYSIPTSSIAYEFTRKFYEILDLNLDNISDKFNAYDLIDITDNKNEVNYKLNSSVLTQNKKFSDIQLDDKVKVGDKIVKFGAVIGNPPYNIIDGGAQASAKPIYQHFVNMSKSLLPNYSSFIVPTRWFAGGKGLDEFREFMLNDYSILEIHDFLTPKDIFPDINNRGGVCYFINDSRKKDPIVKVVTHKDNVIVATKKRKLMIDDIDIFIRDSIGVSVIEKILNTNPEGFFSSIVSPRKPFGIESNIVKTDKFSLTKDNIKKPVVCIGKNRIKGFVEYTEVTSHKEWINQWKVYIPRANNIGTELNDDNLNSFIGEPNSVCTEAYMVVGANKNINEQEARNLCKYITTKFVRFLHKQAKASQDASSKTYKFIPLQNFKNTSDINWETSIEKIDEQLFDKYNLSEEEQKYIKRDIMQM